MKRMTDEETTDDKPDGEDAGEVLEEEEGGEEASGKEAKSCKPWKQLLPLHLLLDWLQIWNLADVYCTPCRSLSVHSLFCASGKSHSQAGSATQGVVHTCLCVIQRGFPLPIPNSGFCDSAGIGGIWSTLYSLHFGRRKSTRRGGGGVGRIRAGEHNELFLQAVMF